MCVCVREREREREKERGRYTRKQSEINRSIEREREREREREKERVYVIIRFFTRCLFTNTLYIYRTLSLCLSLSFSGLWRCILISRHDLMNIHDLITICIFIFVHNCAWVFMYVLKHENTELFTIALTEILSTASNNERKRTCSNINKFGVKLTLCFHHVFVLQCLLYSLLGDASIRASSGSARWFDVFNPSHLFAYIFPILLIQPFFPSS